MENMIVNGKEYRLVTLRGRSKWIASDGDAINPTKNKSKPKIHYNPDRYPCFGGGVPVHLYVAHGWVPGFTDGAEVDHIDFNRNNYDASNLRWVSHIENIKHSAYESDHYATAHSGIKNGRATLTEDEVADIKAYYAMGYKTFEIIQIKHPELDASGRKRLWNKYNRIKTGETWK